MLRFSVLPPGMEMDNAGYDGIDGKKMKSSTRQKTRRGDAKQSVCRPVLALPGLLFPHRFRHPVVVKARPRFARRASILSSHTARRRLIAGGCRTAVLDTAETFSTRSFAVRLQVARASIINAFSNTQIRTGAATRQRSFLIVGRAAAE